MVPRFFGPNNSWSKWYECGNCFVSHFLGGGNLENKDDFESDGGGSDENSDERAPRGTHSSAIS